MGESILTVYDDIIKEREAKIAKLEKEMIKKDQELVDMYKDIQYFYDKRQELENEF
jgi:hypothetical protein